MAYSDSDGALHISYHTTNNHLKHANNYANDSSTWTNEIVDGSSTKSSIAVYGNDVHIAYYDSINQTLKYATGYYAWLSGSGAFTIETVETGYVGNFNSIAVDSQGYAHISHATDYGDLRYAYQNSSGWNLESVQPEYYVQRTAIAIYDLSLIHI